MLRPQVTLKTVLTVGLGVLLLLSMALAVAHAKLTIGLLSAAVLLALGLEHGVEWLVRRKIRRGLAVALVGILLLAGVTGVGLTLIPPAISQGRALAGRAPEYLQRVQRSSLFRRIDEKFDLAEKVENAEKNSAQVLTRAASPVWAVVNGVLTFIGACVSVFVLTMFMLIFGGDLIRNGLNAARPTHREVYDRMLSKIYQCVGGYVGGLTLICGINSTLTTSFLAINGVPFFLPLGLLSGLSSAIPYAGPLLTGAMISLLSFAAGGQWHGIATVIYFLVYGQIEGNILGPLIFRHTVRVNPLFVVVSILLLGEIAGIGGAIVAVPLVATLQVVVGELLLQRSRVIQAERPVV